MLGRKHLAPAIVFALALPISFAAGAAVANVATTAQEPIPSSTELVELQEAAEARLHNPPRHEAFLEGARAYDGWAGAEVGLRESPSQEGQTGYAIFRRVGPTRWRMVSLPDNGCGPGAELPIPIHVQTELELPSCPLAGARLGAVPQLHDSNFRYVTRPSSLEFRTPTHSFWLIHIGPWSGWPVNRAARAEAKAIEKTRYCGADCEYGKIVKQRVRVVARGYGHCGARLVFREIVWTERDGDQVEAKLTCRRPAA